MNLKEVKALMEAYGDVYAPQKVEEVYKGKHGQSDKEYADSRSPGGKMVSGDSKMSGAEYTHGRRVKAANPGMQPDVGGKTKPKSQGRMDRGTRADIEYRKANLKKEELDIFDTVLEFLQAEGFAETLEEAEWMMANVIGEEAIDAILETRMDPRGRPASGPMNVYAKNKPNRDPAFLAALEKVRADDAKKTPEQRKKELDAYKERQRNK